MLRALSHHWRTSLAVGLGAAVAAAVLTGALLVGDSVRASLRQLTLDRLGRIDHAMAAPTFFGEAVVERMRAAEAFEQSYTAAVPAILLRGSLRHAESGARASKVSVQGIDEGFPGLFPEGPGLAELFPEGTGGVFPPVALGAALAEEIGASAGDFVLLSLKRWSAVPRASLLGRKETGDVVETVRLRVSAVVADPVSGSSSGGGLGRFALGSSQAQPLNAFVPLAALQRRLDQEGTINAVLVAASRPGTEIEAAEAQAAELGRLLGEALELEDVGLRLEEGGGWLALESREFVLRPALEDAARGLAEELGAPLLAIQTHLVNGLELGERTVPYSTVAALDTTAPEVFGRLRLVDGSPAPALGPREVLLDAWTAEELGAGVGDEVDLRYFVVGAREELSEETTRFTVAGIAAMEGLAVDPELTQDYPGIGDVDDMSEWDPPFPIDLGRIRSTDEDYWDRYRGAPKAFVAPETGVELWATRWGDVTSMRVAAPAGDSLDTVAESFRRELPERLPRGVYGLVFEPVKALGLEASSGATDFGGLFIGFSLFLIVAAAMLAALLFRLGIEQRAGEVGLLLAMGYPEAKVRRRLLGEGLLLSAAGSLLGLAGAVGYAALMIAGLRTWWQPAVGTSRLFLHVGAGSLALGYALSVGVVLLSIFLTVRRIAKLPATALLRGVVSSSEGAARAGRRARLGVALGLGIAAALLTYAFAAGETSNPGLFFAIGPCLLVGLLAALALVLGGSSPARLEAGRLALLRLGLGNGGRSRGRSLVSATLVATAAFVVVTVAAYQQDPSREEPTLASGTGGFSLMAEADVELHQDLASPEGRFELGLSEAASRALEGAAVIPFRRRPGDDTSCLNLYQPTQPRVLGVPPEMVERGGFTFKGVLGEAPANPWEVLHRELEPGVVPAIGDANSTQWILKLGLGEDLVLEDDLGEPVRLRLVGTLATSIFQSELLISEAAFLRHFPDREGYGTFLVDVPAGEAAEVGRQLEADLAPYGFDAVLAADKLAAFHEVQNTYLSTFQALGGLGLLLGTAGLAVVLLRNVLERRGELATMRAFGFRRRQLTAMVVIENALILVAGLGIGALAALVTVAPHLLEQAAVVPWASIAWTLAAILLFGLLACTLSAAGALRAALLPALKAEG